MKLFECIHQRTSIRRFTQDPLEMTDLHRIIQGARIMPSAANLQPLEYIIVNTKHLCEKIFPHTGWAGYLTPSWTPNENERPTAYIAIINTQPKNKYVSYDVGIAMAYIVLGAQALDIGSCILLNIKKQQIKEILAIPEEIDLQTVIALGRKNETVKRVEREDTVKYWRDDHDIFYVPKRPFSTIIHEQQYKKL